MSIVKSNALIGNWTCDLPACSIMPQPIISCNKLSNIHLWLISHSITATSHTICEAFCLSQKLTYFLIKWFPVYFVCWIIFTIHEIITPSHQCLAECTILMWSLVTVVWCLQGFQIWKTANIMNCSPRQLARGGLSSRWGGGGGS
jgi:hypothetical protein